MSSGGTRAARAATSRQVKNELVKLLFGKRYAKTGPQGHKKLDAASYSYSDLKSAYLNRLQEIHPDKSNANQHATDNKSFHDLQQAWENYASMAKAMEKTSSVQANFTKFGVGCSFSDSDEERALRNEITDQACRGWFSSGLLSATGSDSSSKGDAPYQPNVVSLVDDDLFVEVDSESVDNPPAQQESSPSRKKTLIPNYKGT